jgi:hypothetical protein
MSSKDYWTTRGQDQARRGSNTPQYTPPKYTPPPTGPSWQERQATDWGFKQAQRQINSNSGKK